MKNPETNQDETAGTGFISGYIVKGDLIPMLKNLDSMLDEGNKDKVSKYLATSIAGRDVDVITMVLLQKAESSFGQKLFEYILKEIDDEKFKKVLADIRRIWESPSSEEGVSSAEIETAKQTYNIIAGSERGKRLLGPEPPPKKGGSLKEGISMIIKGEKGAFRDARLLSSLPRAVSLFYEKKNFKTAEAIIDRLGNGLLCEDPGVRSHVSQTLLQIAEDISARGRLDTLCRLSHKLTNWLNIETVMTPICEKICIQLQNLALTLIQKNRFKDCCHILKTFNIIYSEEIRKDEPFRVLAGKVLKTIGSDEILVPIMEEFQKNEENRRKDIVEKLINLGAPAAYRMLQMLKESESYPERSRIMRVISDIGMPAVPALIEQLRQAAPWYYKRNLVLLFGRVGDESHVNLLRPYLSYRDFRVQREALNSIYSIGGNERGMILVSALPSADDRLKVEIVEMLGALEYAEAAPILLELLESGLLVNSKLRNELAEKICNALGEIGSHEAISALNTVIKLTKKDTSGRQPYNEKVRAAAASAWAKIRWKKAQASRGKFAEKSDTSDPVISSELEKALAEREKLVDRYIKRNNLKAAVQTLFDLIVGYASIKNFEKAEELKNKLVYVDSRALSELYRSSQIIDREKSQSIDPSFLQTWTELATVLTNKELYELYHSMDERVYSANQTVCNQGDPDSSLYFIHSGKLQQCFFRGGKEFIISSIEPGNIAGADTFFSISIATTSLITMTDTTLGVLERNVLKRWEKPYPEIASKLNAFCQKGKSIPDIIRENSMDRRAGRRIERSGTVLYLPIDINGNTIGDAQKGDLINIGIGGMSFRIKTSEDPRSLLNQRLNTKFIITTEAVQKHVDRNATIVAVYHQINNTYSVHLKFDSELPGADMVDEEF